MAKLANSGARAAEIKPDVRVAGQSLRSASPVGFLARLRYQLLVGILLTVVAPPLLYYHDNVSIAWEDTSSINTAIGALSAFAIALYLFRRVVSFPGIGLVGHVIPATTAGYGLVLAVFFGLRLDYSRLTFAMSFTSAILLLFVFSAYLRNRSNQRFYVVPSETTAAVPFMQNVEWIVLKKAEAPRDRAAVLIADLRADLGPDWERLIAEMAVAGHPVYHIKQVQESLTGRVEIEHLSENSFGSLIPNLSYRKIKRAIDFIVAAVALPILLLPASLIILLIKLETPGPAFFRQKRRGYRGEVFEVVKFRTMRVGSASQGDERNHAITRDGDSRVTKVGRVLRRTRIDELPQIWNILRGEMSWIGPRPEALALSDWYTAELPFYVYRHIVRPGISGWAQVNQGHVAELTEVNEKLHYDFYYIKNFSAWLDILILGKTIGTVFSGFGAR